MLVAALLSPLPMTPLPMRMLLLLLLLHFSLPLLSNKEPIPSVQNNYYYIK
jgi:hypothetical protein